MGTINLQFASEFEISELPITRYDVEDIINVRKNVQQLDPIILAKYTNISKKKWVEWEEKGLVSFGSKDQHTFDLDHENERGLVQSYSLREREE